MLDCLCPAQINPRHDQASYHEKLTENTAKWFGPHPKFQHWLRARASFLWMHGQSMFTNLRLQYSHQWV